jgi:bifunctional non-homologous end joining protein LigD
MPLQKRRLPFGDANFVFELKYDGFRALAIAERRPELVSRNGHPFGSFADLAKEIAEQLPRNTVKARLALVIHGNDLAINYDRLFRRRLSCFFAFDVLTLEGHDYRTHQLTERKQELRQLLARVPVECPLRYVDHAVVSGRVISFAIC